MILIPIFFIFKLISSVFRGVETIFIFSLVLLKRQNIEEKLVTFITISAFFVIFRDISCDFFVIFDTFNASIVTFIYFF
jgi:hypothetical protein